MFQLSNVLIHLVSHSNKRVKFELIINQLMMNIIGGYYK